MTLRDALARYAAFAAASAVAGAGIAAVFCAATLSGIEGWGVVRPGHLGDVLLVATLGSGAGALAYPFLFAASLAGGHGLASPWGPLGGMMLAPTLVLAAAALLWLVLRRRVRWFPRLWIAAALAVAAGVPTFLRLEGG